MIYDMRLRPVRRRSSIPILLTAAVLAVASCAGTPDLVLDDPAFKHDMVEAAIEGQQFHITPEDYAEIRRLLADERPSYRLAGVILAHQTGAEEFYPLIALAGLDSEKLVAERALEIIRTDYQDYRPVLMDMAESERVSERLGALRLIALTGGEDLVPLVISTFEDPEVSVRNQAALTVRALTGRENPFLREALEDERPLTRAYAIRTLGGYADVRDIGLFIDAFDSADAGVRREAQLAALKVAESGLPALHEAVLDTASSYRTRVSVLNVMQGLRSTESLEVLITLLIDEDQQIAAKAESILGTYGAEATPALIDLYRSSSEVYRAHAVQLMAQIGDSQAFPVLAEALDDESGEVRNLAYEALKAKGEDVWPALRERLLTGDETSVQAALSLLIGGPDPRLAADKNGRVNTDGLFLMITLADRSAIDTYLQRIEVSPIVSETILALKDAWEVGDDFAQLDEDIATGSDPYLYTWRQRELLSVSARETLTASFDRLHEYFDNPDPAILADARQLRAESRQQEAEARALKESLDAMPQAVKARGAQRLQNYRDSRDFLVRTWEYIIPSMQPLAQRVYEDRNLNPETLSRESALLE